MANQSETDIWKLAVGKVNNSLDEEDLTEFKNIEHLNETQNSLKQASQIHSKTKKAFLVQKIDKEKNWSYVLSHIQKASPLKKIILQTSKYAAVFIIALTIGLGLHYFISPNPDVAYNTINLEWGQMANLTLSDGTKVWLNAGTTFRYPSVFNSTERTVTLSGEAQFRVSHNDKVPFEVQTETGKVKVYGTCFNVSSYQDDPEFVVTLIDGKITVEKNHENSFTILKPNDQISINKKTGKIKVEQVETRFYTSWIDGKILLEDSKLSDLTKILSRWYNVDIKLEGEGLSEMKISGTILKGKPLDLFLKIMVRMYGLDYKLKLNNNAKNEVIISKSS